jgi:hypothetical protein
MSERLKSTLGQVQDFKDSFIWRDIEVLLRERLAIINNEMIKAEKMEDLKLLQGRARETQDMIDLPEALLTAIEEQLEEDQYIKEKRNARTTG